MHTDMFKSPEGGQTLVPSTFGQKHSFCLSEKLYASGVNLYLKRKKIAGVKKHNLQSIHYLPAKKLLFLWLEFVIPCSSLLSEGFVYNATMRNVKKIYYYLARN